MDNRTLLKIFGEARSLIPNQVERLSVNQDKYENLRTYFKSFTRAIGIEIETEGLKKTPETSNYWRWVADGSLRNNGVEFVSSPVASNNIDYALAEIEEFCTRNKAVSSIRTSIHVHVNVGDFTLTQLYGIVGLYALFEPLFFRFQSKFRQNNPYCYPLLHLCPKTVDISENMKYCAFNLGPIPRQVSVEFRHADFSTDWLKNRRWIQLVCRLMKFAENNRDNLREIVFSTVENGSYAELLRSVMKASSFLIDEPALMAEGAPWAVAYIGSHT